MEKIDSTSNKFIKSLKKLKQKKQRYEEKQYIVEGLNSVKEFLNYKKELCICLLVTRDYMDKLSLEGVNTILVSPQVMESICETKTPQGVALVARLEESKRLLGDTIVYLDNVKDPGNVGTIIRTADASGIETLILSRECADLYNSKTIRSSMGSMFHINVFYEEEYLSALKELKENGYSIVCGALDTEKSLYETDFKKKTVICIGNEAHGISQELYSMGVQKIKIPIVGCAESLNAAVAAGIIMYEALRQRNSG